MHYDIFKKILGAEERKRSQIAQQIIGVASYFPLLGALQAESDDNYTLHNC